MYSIHTVRSNFSMTNTREKNRFTYDVHYTKRERYIVAFGKFDCILILKNVHEVKYNLLANTVFNIYKQITYYIKEFTLQEKINQYEKIT